MNTSLHNMIQLSDILFLKSMQRIEITDIVTVTIIVSIFYVIYLVWKPLNRIRLLSEVGWSHLLNDNLRKRKLADVIRESQKRRKIGDLPPVFPNGWFAVAESRFLRKGAIKSISAFGELLAVFRGEDGKAYVLDAYCPHLGADMTVGGVVKGECLQCPFHGWVFEGESGTCKTIPYSSKVPEFSKVRRWQTKELNGFIYVWYDSEKRDPYYELPVVEEIKSNIWKYRGRTEHEVMAHIQEVPENGSDLAHLAHLHVPFIMKGADLNKAFSKNKVFDIVKHEWNGEWSQKEGESHIAQVKLTHSLSFFNGLYNIFGLSVTVQQVGPSVVYLLFDTPLGKGMLMQNVTPMEPLQQKIIHHFYTSSMFVAPIAKILMIAEANHVERDIMIWNSKKYISNPLLVKEDKMIAKFRRWYSQFYSQNSPRIEHLKKSSLDW